MAESPLTESVRDFIANHIDSVAELEALLLIRRYPQSSWSAAALAERLYIPEEQAGEAAERLHLLGLAVAKGGTYRYGPSTPELDEAVGRVAEAYSKYLIPVTNLIHSKPQSRVQQFAEAFRLRKRSDE
jgi:hypothetical protein